jgi:hypothetical protein
VSAAWRSRRWWPSGDVADPLVERIADRMGRLVVGPGSDPASEMGPLVTREHRDRVAGYVAPGSRRVRGAGRRTQAGGPRGRGRVLARALPARPCDPGDDRLPRRDLRPGALGAARRHFDEAIALVNANPYGNGTAVFTGSGRRPTLPARDRGRHGRHQRADPGADGVLLLRRLEGLPLRGHPCPRHRRVSTSTRAARSSPRGGRGAGSSRGGTADASTLHFPTSS